MVGIQLLFCTLLNFQLVQPTIGVVDFQFKPNKISHSSETKYFWRSSDTKSLMNEIEMALTKSRKFNVLDRQKSKVLFKELEYDEDNKIETYKLFKEKSLKKSTFVVVGEITHFRAARMVNKIAYSERTRVTHQVRLITTMRVLSANDGAIVFSDKTDVQIPGGARADLLTLVEKAKINTSELLVGRLMDELFPVTVIKSMDEDVYLTRTKDVNQKVGKVLVIYSVNDGEDLFDPQTNEYLGTSEKAIAEVRITEIRPKFVKAKILTAKGNIRRGDLCRPKAPLD